MALSLDVLTEVGSISWDLKDSIWELQLYIIVVLTLLKPDIIFDIFFNTSWILKQIQIKNLFFWPPKQDVYFFKNNENFKIFGTSFGLEKGIVIFFLQI